MNKNFIVKNLNGLIFKKELSQIKKLVKEENHQSILASLDDNLLNKYLNRCIQSKQLFLYTCEFNKKIIGYSIFAKKTIYLITEFLDFRFNVLSSLFFSLNFKSLINLALVLTGLDIILMNSKNKKIISNSLNLNLIAIKRNFQSKGVGKYFLDSCIKDIKKSSSFNSITLETFDSKALSFYEKKMNFKRLCFKLRFFSILKVLIKKNK